MNKKRAKFNFCLVAILLVVALVFCFASFKLPASNDDYNGLFNSISATSDITDGYFAEYNILTEDANQKDIGELILNMNNILYDQGFANVNIYKMGNKIRVEVNKADNAVNILSIIGEPKSFFISATEADTLEEADLASYDIKGTDIKNAYSSTQYNIDDEYNSITIEFNKSGADKYHELTRQVYAKEEANRKIFFYIGGAKQTSLPVQSVSSDSSLSFYSTSYSKELAQNFALQILMSSTGVNVELSSYGTTSATIGMPAFVSALCILLVLFIAILVVLPILFGDLGFVADLSIAFGAVASIFLLQALPIVTMSLTGILGAIFGLGIMGVCHFLYLNKMKSEFYYLKRLPLSAKTAFKKSWLKILDICLIPIISGISLGFWNIPFVSSFGIAIAVVAFVSLFNSVVILKDFVTWYITINNKNYKRVKFTKEAGNE